MANTSTVEIPLDVLNKYSAIVKESLGPDSVYIRAKETIGELFDDSDITSADKASAISNIVGNMVNGITNSSMSAALEWAKYEKEIALKKLEMDKQLAILDKESTLKQEQIDQIKLQNRLSEVESRRMYGEAVFDVQTGALLSISDEGKVWDEMELTKQKTINATSENNLIESKLKESKAAIHKVVADTYINFGNFSYSFSDTDEGISTVTRLDKAETNRVSLSDTQQKIAIEQGKGYTYNAWANALTGSASMVGTALASEAFTFNAGSPEKLLLDTIANCAYNLNKASSADDYSAEPAETP